MASIEFDNLGVLISIVIGVAVTQSLVSVSAVVRHPHIRAEPLYIIWFVIALILNIEFVWNLRLQTMMSLSLIRALVYMLGPITLFLMTDILTIRDDHTGPVSSLPNQPIFFIAGITYFLSQVTAAVLVKGETFSHPQNIFRYAAILLFVFGACIRGVRKQYAIAVIALLTLVAYAITTDYLPNPDEQHNKVMQRSCGPPATP